MGLSPYSLVPTSRPTCLSPSLYAPLALTRWCVRGWWHCPPPDGQGGCAEGGVPHEEGQGEVQGNSAGEHRVQSGQGGVRTGRGCYGRWHTCVGSRACLCLSLCTCGRASMHMCVHHTHAHAQSRTINHTNHVQECVLPNHVWVSLLAHKCTCPCTHL